MKIALFTLFTLLSLQALNADKTSLLLLEPNDNTSLINYAVHSRALDAVKKQAYEDAFMIYLKLADKGDERAEYNVAIMYMNGLGTQKDTTDSFKWMRRSAKHGNKEALLYFEKTDKATKQTSTKIAEPIKERYLPKESVQSTVLKQEQKPTGTDNDETKNILYVVTTFVILTFILGLYLLKKISKETKEESLPPDTLKEKSDMFKSTYTNILKYHTQLLKHFNVEKYNKDTKKMQLYYMFIAGMIDYFSQLEEFSESEKHRIFSTHMGKMEGEENVTTIMQAILEGQRDHSFYHCHAAGSMSAQEWKKTGSASAFLMLKDILKKEAH